MTGRTASPGDRVITLLGAPLITAVVLPEDGGVHALSRAMAPGVDDPEHPLWAHASATAAARGRPVLVRVGRPGRIDAYTVTTTGARTPHRLAQRSPAAAPDPRWSEEPPDRDGLLNDVFAAEDTGDFEAAIKLAADLGARLHAELGPEHPHLWLIAELQADLNLLAHHGDQAAALYCKVAAARYNLRSPEPPALGCLRRALMGWQWIGPSTGPVGLALAHTLIAYLPARADVLHSVLQHLPDDLLPTQRSTRPGGHPRAPR